MLFRSNCHDGDGDSPGANEPYWDATGGLWCPFHTYRVSGDARPTYGSLLGNLNATRRLASLNLSLPGCWAYADMMEIGVTATGGMHDCGPTGNDTCVPLSVTEARTHFGAWAIVSSPLVLGFDLRDGEMLDRHWQTITNTDAIAINHDYAGHSGSLMAHSEEQTTLPACDWKAGVSCEWPLWMAWHKPLSGRDARGSIAAILLMNNGDESVDSVCVPWIAVPGLPDGTTSCQLYDVWERKVLGRSASSANLCSAPLASRESAFLTLSDCHRSETASH